MVFRDYGVNPTVETIEQAVSTFSVDVDTASYSLARRFLEQGRLPPESSVRVEEFLNRFDYGYEAPTEAAFSLWSEAVASPNRRGYHVLHLGIKGVEVPESARKPANLVFVVDASSSMGRDGRLDMAKDALRLLLGRLGDKDTVAVIIYGSSARVLLAPTSAAERSLIMDAIDLLRPEGSTNVQAGLRLAYDLASEHFIPHGINRLILCSDGMANSGLTEADAIFETVRKRAEHGVSISTVGFGMGHYNDVLMERVADMGNGN
jgi:Ca-activated chloride channel family protein